MTTSVSGFGVGVLVGIALTSGTVLVAQMSLGGMGGAAGAGAAMQSLNDQRFRASLLQLQPEPQAMNPYGARFHEALIVVANPTAAELIAVDGHVFCQATSRNDSLVGWVLAHRGQAIDVHFTTD